MPRDTDWYFVFAKDEARAEVDLEFVHDDVGVCLLHAWAKAMVQGWRRTEVRSNPFVA